MKPAEDTVGKAVIRQSAQIKDGRVDVYTPNQEKIIHSFVKDNEEVFMKRTVIIVYIILTVFGVLTGYVLARGKLQSLSPSRLTGATDENSAPTVAGIEDYETFKDTATGVLESGGIESEGTHHLVRDENNPTQTVYLISSTVDLDKYIGKTVKVWGVTMAAKNAPWFMDVGRLEVQ